ncbi:MAG: FAD:protein FMN transferase [Eubacterium sp.]
MKKFNFNSIISKIGAVCIGIFIIIAIVYGIKFGVGSIKSFISQTPFSKTYFDTVVSLEIYSSDSSLSNNELINNCYDLCEKYENMFSTTIKGSDIYKINHSKGEAVEVNSDTIIVINKSLFFSEYSDGAFDITIGPLSSLWNFGSNSGKVPDASDIEQKLNLVDYNNINVVCDENNNGTVQLTNPDAAIDLGGIAKGYAADKVKEYLVSEGVTSAIINFGGNILTIGCKPNSAGFTIGIQKPFAKTNETAATVSVNNKAVVTSGVYERYFYKKEVLYHHILDTSTGYPCDNGIYSVTVMTDSSCDADALSTTCLALGLEKGKELIEFMINTEAVFILEDGTIETTSGIKNIDGVITYIETVSND